MVELHIVHVSELRYPVTITAIMLSDRFCGRVSLTFDQDVQDLLNITMLIAYQVGFEDVQ